MYTLGIDIGSTTSKCVILKDGAEVVKTSLAPLGTGTTGPMSAFNSVLSESGLKKEDMALIMATGYGRTSFEFADEQISELSAHAKGVHHVHPDCRTIIDIGGQDAKAISLSEKGTLSNFVMNDKCAAGTGRFLDVMAGILGIDINDMGAKALKATSPVKISSTCTVFAESEVISQLSKNVNLDDLIAGICQSVAARSAALVKRLGIKEAVYMSGGVAKNDGVRAALSAELGLSVTKAQDSQFMGALGAAVAAYEKANK